MTYLETGADVRRYHRYRLWRRWSPGQLVLFVMLNPSTADGAQDDPTIRRCVGFARSWGHEVVGYGGVMIVNLYGLRATRPQDLWRDTDPVGGGNALAIADGLRATELTIAAWGQNQPPADNSLWQRTDHERHLGDVLRQLRARRPVYALRLTKLGHPEHPLRLPRTLTPTVWKRRTA